MSSRPYRSVLYLPASRERVLEKARVLPTDAIIFDLEDAVAPSEKELARELLVRELSKGGYGARAQISRINALDTPWGADDVRGLASAKPEAILLPKVNSPKDITDLAALMDEQAGYEDTQIWAMIESPRGVLNAPSIAMSERLAGFVVGTNDLAKDLNTRFDPARTALQTSLSMAVLAARAAGIVVVDGVYNAFKDEDGLVAEAQQGRDFGFHGKTLIHPSQIGPTNEVFAPNPEELDLAHRQIEAFEEALKNKTGIAIVDGKIVENLHVETAKDLIATAKMIEELSS